MSRACWLASETGTSSTLIGVAATSPSPRIGDIGRDGAHCCSCIHKKGIKNRIANTRKFCNC
jgi:hypothetical protein